MRFNKFISIILLISPFSSPMMLHQVYSNIVNLNPIWQDTINLSGIWEWEGRPMNDRDVIRNGRMEITLHQNGAKLAGTLIQINGPHGDIPKSGYVEGWSAQLQGIIIPAIQPKYNMVRLRRINIDNDFEAIFTGNISNDGKRIDGYFVNNLGVGGGWFVMRKKEITEAASSNSDVKKLGVHEEEAGRQAILGMIDDFQRGFTEKDSTLLFSLFDQSSTPVVGVDEKEISRQTAQQFIEYVVSSNQKIEEKLRNVIINVRNSVAVMSCDYDYIVDGKMLGSGIEVWTLIKTPDGWRIASFLWSD
jgi:hypothetical protein